MEETILSPHIVEGRVTGIGFSLATHNEICISSISDCPISHPSQLTNPFLGLPLESGKCESCGTAEPGACDGHFGYIELPIPVYHPSHVSELKRLLSMICLKCLRLKKGKSRNDGASEKSSNAPCLFCLEIPQISIKEGRAEDGKFCLELHLPPKSRLRDGFWNFLERYGFRYGYDNCRILLPCEVLEILKRIPDETRKKLAGRGYFPQDGYILQKLPVPPNCLSVPEISDGVSIMASDLSVSILKKVLKQVEIIRSSRSGPANFESSEVEANDLQSAISQYLHIRGTTKASRDVNTRFGINKETDSSSTKAWLEKMRTLFIRKGSGFSSRSVITGDAYKKVNEIGLPLEIAQRITFEEKVTEHNKKHLQDLVDKKLCLTYRDGVSTYSLREGSMGHTSLRVGQVVHRRIMDGDIVFINRPPSTHKHSLQALSVYVHDDHTVKINPLICVPLGADFDGDCIHLFYPQSLAAKAEVLELFSVEQQLLSSHTGKLNLQLANDALLSLKIMFKQFFFDKTTAQQLSMFVSRSLQQPALLKANSGGPRWTALQIIQNAFPSEFDCSGERYLISGNEMVKVDFNRDVLQSLFDEIISYVFFKKGSREALKVFNSLQPLLMENIFLEGYSVSLRDFCVDKEVIRVLQKNVQDISPLLHHLRSTYNELVELQVENHLRTVKLPVVNFILKASALGNLIDSKSESSINKVVQQIGFLGLQISDRGKFYNRTLVEDMTSLFKRKYAVNGVDYPSEAFGLIKSSFFQGLNPYEELVQSISSREVLVRSSRGLTEPGTLFKNLMAILRDVVICYDGTVRNICSNSVLQFEYGGVSQTNHSSFYPAGEPVGVLAATAISNPAYKAVLDSSPSSNSSWELMKEILLCKVRFQNDLNDRRVILYLNDCGCGKKYCKENAAYVVQNQLKRVSLKDIASDFLIEYQKCRASPESSETNAGLVGHIHLNKMRLKELGRSMLDLLQECQETVNNFRKKKKRLGGILKGISLSVSDCCCFQPSCDMEWSQFPCLQFFLQDTRDHTLEKTSLIMANMICPILLETIVKGDPRVCLANIIWVSPDTTTWVRKYSEVQKGELALEVVLEKSVVKQNGDAWRTVMDSCLPVIHLIDTRRSIPYAIKQVQELLGISCAFDQVIQRLSTSVRMVSKGVIKEHLLLVAASMACSGDLIGFNPSGYKAMFRSLNVQVPFTEATLYTPRKCFERAAEKFHTDSLSSIVASCSWGKRVAVGTGSRFEIFWNKKEIGLEQDGPIDVYNFLQLVRSPKEVELNSACLGEEVDDIGMENDVQLCSSPENFDNGKPIFEDTVEVACNLEQNNAPEEVSSGWEVRKVDQNTSMDNGWNTSGVKPVESSGWNAQKVDVDNGWNTSVVKPVESSGWNAQKVDVDNGWNTSGVKPVESSGWNAQKVDQDTSMDSGWNTNGSKPVESSGWGAPKADQNTSMDTGWNTSGKKPVESSSWEARKVDAQKVDQTTSMDTGWNTGGRKPVESSSWEPRNVDKNTSLDTAWNSSGGKPQWGQKESHNLDTNMTRDQEDQPIISQGGVSSNSGWGANKDFTPESHSTKASDKSSSSGGWNSMEFQNKRSSQTEPTWGKQAEKTDSTWNKKEEKTEWGKQAEDAGSTWNKMDETAEREKQAEDADSSWNKMEKKGEWGKAEDSCNWGTTKVQKTENHSAKESSSTGWNKMQDQKKWPSQPESCNSWGKQVEKDDAGNNTSGRKAQWGQWKESISVDTNSIKKQDDQQISLQGLVSSSAGWGIDKVHTPESNSMDASVKSPGSGGWNSNDFQNKRPSPTPWGKQAEESESTWNRREDKSQWGRPPRSQGKPDDWNSSGILTATRQRLDQFTTEEQSILSEVEPVILSTRRIMNQARDGDPLSPEDQLYVLDNVFNYHPDKAAKTGSGVDFVTVSKHSSFQDTRCFYIVSTDGRKEDFSYLKCVENFVKHKYPELANTFNSKYFRKSRPAGGSGRENEIGSS